MNKIFKIIINKILSKIYTMIIFLTIIIRLLLKNHNITKLNQIK